MSGSHCTHPTGGAAICLKLKKTYLMMTEARSKRRFLLLLFILQCFIKPLLLRLLKQDNQLRLFRRLEQCRQIATVPLNSFVFVKIFDPTLTFTKVDQGRRRKWKRSSETFSKSVLAGEL